MYIIHESSAPFWIAKKYFYLFVLVLQFGKHKLASCSFLLFVYTAHWRSFPDYHHLSFRTFIHLLMTSFQEWGTSSCFYTRRRECYEWWEGHEGVLFETCQSWCTWKGWGKWLWMNWFNWLRNLLKVVMSSYIFLCSCILQVFLNEYEYTKIFFLYPPLVRVLSGSAFAIKFSTLSSMGFGQFIPLWNQPLNDKTHLINRNLVGRCWWHVYHHHHYHCHWRRPSEIPLKYILYFLYWPFHWSPDMPKPPKGNFLSYYALWFLLLPYMPNSHEAADLSQIIQ